MIKAFQVISAIVETQEPYLVLKGPGFIRRAARNLSKFLPYVKVSSLNYRGISGFDINAGDTYVPRQNLKDIGHAITTPGYRDATGISVFVSPDEELVIFQEITSEKPGFGTKMIDAIISELPKDWLLQIHHDMSGGFWESIKRRYSDWKWNLENSFSTDRGDNIYQLWGDRDRGIIELRVIDISGKTQSRRQFEMPFRTPQDFHEVEDEVKKEVNQTNEYITDRRWKEVPFKSMY